jgi:hypothetical protein
LPARSSHRGQSFLLIRDNVQDFAQNFVGAPHHGNLRNGIDLLGIDGGG